MALLPSYNFLESLLDGVRFAQVYAPQEKTIVKQQITAVTADSRQVVPGALFIAVAGLEFDGHDFIDDALNRGCMAVICETGRKSVRELGQLSATVVEVEDTAVAYAQVAANYFGRPAEKMQFIGVTGTNGKTTVTYLLEHVLLAAGYNVGVIGTVTNRYTTRAAGGKTVPAQFTTPEVMQLQQLLREMADNDVDYVVMEVSSHGLAQSRIATLSFDVAAFTNLSRDHLDYHTDMEDYFSSKLRLFTDHVKDGGTVVLPQVEAGRENSRQLETLHQASRIAGSAIITWGQFEPAAIRLLSYNPTLESTEVIFSTASGEHRINSPLVGFYNVENLLTAFGLSTAIGIDEELICDTLSSAIGAPGRVERISGGPDSPVVLVDYAHTPDALEKVLGTVGVLPHRLLFSVFGCGGNRDKGKRAVMGEIGTRLSDVAIVTDDNPRNEDPDEIVRQILVGAGCRQEQMRTVEWLEKADLTEGGVIVIRDRRQAIEAAIKAATSGDIVVIAGKGHEPYQITREGRRFFDDRLEAARVLNSWTTEQVCTAVGGVVIDGQESSQLLGEVVTDSRLKGTKSIFVALKGETHDAHLFGPQAVDNGARCLVVENKIDLGRVYGPCQVLVKDSLQALGDLAAYRRRKLAGTREQVVIGLTGSCGKTTVKEMTAAILERKWPGGKDFPQNCVLKTKGNFNNLIGLPLSLLPLDVHHRAAVMEMGMNRPGELHRLGEIADPDISCITNIYGAHLEGLQSIEGVAKAKEELFAVTKSSGTLVVNLDDSRVKKAAEPYGHQKITFSATGDSACQADVWASEILLKKDGTTTFTLHHGESTAAICLCIAGTHNVSNALCAAAIAVAAGADLDQVQAGLADFRPPDKRMEMIQVRAGFALLNDTYNANPASMTAGLRTLRQLTAGKSVAIIGDMLELGSAADEAHYGVGKLLAELGIDYAGVAGDFRQTVLQGALDHGFVQQRIRLFDDKDDAALWINDLARRKKLGPGDLVLVKASRGLRFETVVAKIIE